MARPKGFPVRISEGSTLRTPFADELNGTERSEGLI